MRLEPVTRWMAAPHCTARDCRQATAARRSLKPPWDDSVSKASTGTPRMSIVSRDPSTKFRSAKPLALKEMARGVPPIGPAAKTPG